MIKQNQPTYITNKKLLSDPEFENKIYANHQYKKKKILQKKNLHLNLSNKKLSFNNPLFKLSELDKRLLPNFKLQINQTARSQASFRITTLTKETQRVLRMFGEHKE